jgi:hypothetical protein
MCHLALQTKKLTKSVCVATPWEKFSACLPSEERSLPPSSSARRFLARISADRPGRVPRRGQRSGHTAPTLPGYLGLKIQNTLYRRKIRLIDSNAKCCYLKSIGKLQYGKTF